AAISTARILVTNPGRTKFTNCGSAYAAFSCGEKSGFEPLIRSPEPVSKTTAGARRVSELPTFFIACSPESCHAEPRTDVSQLTSQSHRLQNQRAPQFRV